MAGVFGPRQDAESENGDDITRALSGFDVTRKVFLCLLSLHQQRKQVAEGESSRLGGRSPPISALRGKVKPISPWGARYFLLLAQKKVPKENGLPRDVKPVQGACRIVAISGLAIHGSVRKRPPSMAGALRVCGTRRDLWKIKGVGDRHVSLIGRGDWTWNVVVAPGETVTVYLSSGLSTACSVANPQPGRLRCLLRTNPFDHNNNNPAATTARAGEWHY